MDAQVKNPVNTLNKFLVASRRHEIVLLNPPKDPLSHDDALVLAAFLVAMVHDDKRWAEVYEAVCNA